MLTSQSCCSCACNGLHHTVSALIRGRSIVRPEHTATAPLQEQPAKPKVEAATEATRHEDERGLALVEERLLVQLCDSLRRPECDDSDAEGWQDEQDAASDDAVSGAEATQRHPSPQHHHGRHDHHHHRQHHHHHRSV